MKWQLEDMDCMSHGVSFNYHRLGMVKCCLLELRLCTRSQFRVLSIGGSSDFHNFSNKVFVYNPLRARAARLDMCF